MLTSPAVAVAPTNRAERRTDGDDELRPRFATRTVADRPVTSQRRRSRSSGIGFELDASRFMTLTRDSNSLVLSDFLTSRISELKQELWSETDKNGAVVHVETYSRLLMARARVAVTSAVLPRTMKTESKRDSNSCW